MSTNPFFRLNCAPEQIDNLRFHCVDREEELRLCHTAIVERYHNVLLYGTRGTGKTFLVRLVEDRINKMNAPIFPAFVRLSGLPCYGAIDAVSSFSRAVLLQICCTIWTGVLGKSYLSLRERLDEAGNEIALRDEPESVVQKVYSLLMTSERKTRLQALSSIGFTAAVKGEKKEEKTLEKQQSEVLPFEFAEFVDELISRALKPLGKERVVVLCDEANLLPIFEQQDILERYFELFNHKNVQFLFVAGFQDGQAKLTLPDCFETHLELKGFPERKYVLELVNRADKGEVTFSDEAIDVLWRNFSGHPRKTLEVCGLAFEEARKLNQSVLSGGVAESICASYMATAKERSRRRK